MKLQLSMILLLFLAACQPAMEAMPMEKHDDTDGHHEETDHGHSMEMIEANAEILTSSPIKEGIKTLMKVKLSNKEGNPLQGMMPHHAKLVHVVFMHEDLDTLGHVHPEDFGEITQEMKDLAEYPIEFVFPKAGHYVAAVDIMTGEGTFSAHLPVMVEGKKESYEISKDFSRTKCFTSYPEQGHDRFIDSVSLSGSEVECPEGYEITLDVPEHVHTNEDVTLKYHIEKDGQPVADMQKFLAAGVHLAIVQEGLGTIMHKHGESHMETFGPDIESETITFPKAGIYVIESQLKHNNEIIFANFMIDIAEGHTDDNH